MFKWFQYLRAIPQLLALVRELLDLIRHAEDLLAGGGRGTEKKVVVLALLETAVNLGQTLGIPEAEKVDRAKLRTAASGVIDTVVTVLNSTGVFKRAATPPTS